MAKSTKAVPAGKLIRRQKDSGHVPPWVAYSIGGVIGIGGIAFIFDTITTRNGSPVAQSLLGLVFAAIGIAIIITGWRTPPTKIISFHDGGVVIDTGPYSEYFPYPALESVRMEIRTPSKSTQAWSVARGVFSLLVGNFVGLGWAVGAVKTFTSVQIQIPERELIATAAFSAEETEQVANIVEVARREQVLFQSFY